MLAAVDVNVVGGGIANFDFQLGPLGAVNDGAFGQPGTALNPSFVGGSASFSSVCLGLGPFPYCGTEPEPEPEPNPMDNVPEPSSTVLLTLGAAGMVARRRRS